MSVMELKAEIERLRDDLILARTERDKLSDERDATFKQYEEEFKQRRLALQQTIREKVDSAKAPLLDKVSQLKTELDWMNRAASGDPCGWRKETKEMKKRTQTSSSSPDDNGDDDETRIITY
eukprot:4247213-Ditylum_brightwellii.AAC.1